MEYYTNGEWIKPTQTVSGNKITVTGLSANTSYTFRAHYIDAITATNTSVSSEITITTESASQVPNADMNDWNTEATKKVGKTKWNGLNPTTYYAYIPKSGSWATSNAKTFNHSSSGTMNYAINAYPSVVKETRTNNGEVAIVRSIGWNDGAGNSYEGITGKIGRAHV